MNTIINIIKMDIVSIFSKKGGQLISIIAMLVLGILVSLIGVFFMPDFLAYYLVMIGFFISPMIINQETKSESAKALCVIPTDRKNIVLARYILPFSVYTIISVILFTLIKISIIAGFETEIISFELIFMYLYLNGLPAMSLDAISNMVFFVCYMIGLIIMSGQMRSYFKNGAVSSSFMKKFLKILLMIILFYAVGIAFMFLCTVPIIQTTITMILTVIISLAMPADGILLSSVMVVIGLGILIYNVICSVIEYGSREL